MPEDTPTGASASIADLRAAVAAYGAGAPTLVKADDLQNAAGILLTALIPARDRLHAALISDDPGQVHEAASAMIHALRDPAPVNVQQPSSVTSPDRVPGVGEARENLQSAVIDFNSRGGTRDGHLRAIAMRDAALDLLHALREPDYPPALTRLWQAVTVLDIATGNSYRSSPQVGEVVAATHALGRDLAPRLGRMQALLGTTALNTKPLVVSEYLVDLVDEARDLIGLLLTGKTQQESGETQQEERGEFDPALNDLSIAVVAYEEVRGMSEQGKALLDAAKLVLSSRNSERESGEDFDPANRPIDAARLAWDDPPGDPDPSDDPKACPYCAFRATTTEDEISHMIVQHPNIVHSRRVAAGVPWGEASAMQQAEALEHAERIEEIPHKRITHPTVGEALRDSVEILDAEATLRKAIEASRQVQTEHQMFSGTSRTVALIRAAEAYLDLMTRTGRAMPVDEIVADQSDTPVARIERDEGEWNDARDPVTDDRRRAHIEALRDIRSFMGGSDREAALTWAIENLERESEVSDSDFRVADAWAELLSLASWRERHDDAPKIIDRHLSSMEDALMGSPGHMDLDEWREHRRECIQEHAPRLGLGVSKVTSVPERDDMAIQRVRGIVARMKVHWQATDLKQWIELLENAVGKDRSYAASPERIAEAFHEEYERLAPQYGYETRPESAVPWLQVPEVNQQLMVNVVASLIHKGYIL